MAQHNPADDAASEPQRESHAGEIHQARGQPTVSPTDHGEQPETTSGPASTMLEAASVPVGVERAAECPALFPRSSAQGSAAAQANQHRVRIQSDQREQIDVDLLIQAILIIAEEMAAPSDREDAALT